MTNNNNAKDIARPYISDTIIDRYKTDDEQAQYIGLNNESDESTMMCVRNETESIMQFQSCNKKRRRISIQPSLSRLGLVLLMLTALDFLDAFTGTNHRHGVRMQTTPPGIIGCSSSSPQTSLLYSSEDQNEERSKVSFGKKKQTQNSQFRKTSGSFVEDINRELGTPSGLKRAMILARRYMSTSNFNRKELSKSLNIIGERAFSLALLQHSSSSRHNIGIGLECLHRIWSIQSGIPRSTLILAIRAFCKSPNFYTNIDVKNVTSYSMHNDEIAYRLLQRLLTNKGLQHQRRRISEREFNMVLNALVSTSHLTRGRRLLKLQNRHSEHVGTSDPVSAVGYSILIKGYGKVLNIQSMEALWKEAQRRGVKEDVIMFNSIADAYVRAEKVQEAEALLDYMRNDAKVLPNSVTYNTIMKGVSSRGDLEDVFQLCKEMEKLNLRDDVTTNIMVNAAVRVEEYDTAETILTDWYNRDSEPIYSNFTNGKPSLPKQHPNVQAYTELLDGYAKSGNLEKALGTLQLMKKRNVPPNEITYTCMISALARDGKTAQAEKMMQFMESNDRIRATTVTYNAVISALLVSSGDDSQQIHPNVYNTRMDEALSFLGRMITSGVPPDDITASALIEGMAKCTPSRINEVPNLLKTIRSHAASNLDPTRNVKVGTAFIKAYTSSHLFHGATTAFRSMASPDIIALNTYLDACCRVFNQPKVAFDTFKEFCSEGRIEPDVITYSILISVLAKLDNAVAAKRLRMLYHEMRTNWGIQPDITLVDIILSAMLNGSKIGFEKADVEFCITLLRDASQLQWPPEEYSKRKKLVQNIIVGRISEVWKEDEDIWARFHEEEDELFRRKGWNKVDSSFRLFGEVNGGGEREETMDQFLASKGWNDMDSGFRIL